jgi:hypothetical protein
MPANLQTWIVPRQADGILGGRLAHHQTGAVQHAVTLGVNDGAVGLRAHPKIIRNEKHFSAVHV